MGDPLGGSTRAQEPREQAESLKKTSLRAMAKGRPSGLQGLATMNEAGKVIFCMAYSHVEAQGDETKGNPLPLL